MHAALAGTQFSVSPGPPWSEQAGEAGAASSSEHAGLVRKTELVCIGQELDHAAAAKALDGCLLTDAEMERGVASWMTLPNPFREALQ